MKKKIYFSLFIMIILGILWQFPNIYRFLILEQKHFIQLMKQSIREQQDGVLGILIVLTFFYGLIHSLGPGHGKSFLVTYVLKEKIATWKLLCMTAMIAYLQAFLAYVFVTFILDLASQSSMLSLYTFDQKTRFLSAIMIVFIAFFDFLLLLKKKEKSSKECWLFAAVVGLCPCPGVMSVLLFLNLLGYEVYSRIFALSTATGIFCMLSVFGFMAGKMKEYLVQESSPKILEYLHIIGIILLFGIGIYQIYFSIFI